MSMDESTTYITPGGRHVPAAVLVAGARAYLGNARWPAADLKEQCMFYDGILAAIDMWEDRPEGMQPVSRDFYAAPDEHGSGACCCEVG